MISVLNCISACVFPFQFFFQILNGTNFPLGHFFKGQFNLDGRIVTMACSGSNPENNQCSFSDLFFCVQSHCLHSHFLFYNLLVSFLKRSWSFWLRIFVIMCTVSRVNQWCRLTYHLSVNRQSAKCWPRIGQPSINTWVTCWSSFNWVSCECRLTN